MSSNFAAIPVPRGCGEREQDGMYWELGFSDGGRPLIDFLFDPPLPIPPDLDIPAIGMKPIVDGNGIVHLCDHVGTTHYPNLPDFLEEAARFGFSRRMPTSLFTMTVEVNGVKRPVMECLTQESRLLMVHEKAIVTNWGETIPYWMCPKGLSHHAPLAYEPDHDTPDCLGRLWYSLPPVPEEGTPISEGGGYPVNAGDWPKPAGGIIPNMLGGEHFVDASSEWLVMRIMPSFEYYAVTRPPDAPLATYTRAFFGSIPCSRIVVVKGERSAEIAARAAVADLPVFEVDA